MRDPSLNGKPWFCEMPIKYSVEVSPGNSMSDVSASLTSLCAVDPAVKHAVPSLLSGRSLLVLCEQLGYKIFKTYQSLQSASMVTSREQLFGYELPRGSATELYSHVSFSHARPGTKSSMLEGFGLPFSCPFFIDIPITVLSFYQTVFRAISCYVRDELWTSIGAPIFIPGDSTSEQILNAKAELQKVERHFFLFFFVFLIFCIFRLRMVLLTALCNLMVVGVWNIDIGQKMMSTRGSCV